MGQEAGSNAQPARAKRRGGTPRRRHVPLRSCIACQERRAKRDLIRVVRTPEGAIEVDPRGKRSGRGAYVCANPACLDAALKQGRLSHALKCQVSAEQVAALREQFEVLCQSSDERGHRAVLEECG